MGKPVTLLIPGKQHITNLQVKSYVIVKRRRRRGWFSYEQEEMPVCGSMMVGQRERKEEEVEVVEFHISVVYRVSIECMELVLNLQLPPPTGMNHSVRVENSHSL